MRWRRRLYEPSVTAEGSRVHPSRLHGIFLSFFLISSGIKLISSPDYEIVLDRSGVYEYFILLSLSPPGGLDKGPRQCHRVLR